MWSLCVPLRGDEAERERKEEYLDLHQEVSKCGLVGVQLTDEMGGAQVQENRCPSHWCQLPHVTFWLWASSFGLLLQKKIKCQFDLFLQSILYLFIYY